MNLFNMRADKRRAARNERKVYDPINLNQRHQEIINLHMVGLTDSQISSALGVSKVTVSYALRSTLGQEKISILRSARDAEALDSSIRIKNLIPKALDIYETILSEDNERGLSHGGASIALQKATADTIVKDLGGLAAPKKLVVGHTTLTAAMLEEIKANGRNAAKECGLVVDTVADVL